MVKFFNTYVSDATSVVTGAFALSNIEHTLSIIILILSIGNILWNLGYRIYSHIKNKELDKVDDDFKTGIEELENLKEKTKKKEGKQ